jgi:amino acid adenylation domain-containing protein
MTIGQIVEAYPLSPMQQGMLFHSLYAPQSGVYVQQLVCTLRENLQIAAFKHAWQRVIARHPILRTSVRWEGDAEPVQEVQQQVSLPWEAYDWRGMSAPQQAHCLETYLHDDRQRGFVLTSAPLMHLALFRMAEADYRLVWTSHHALLDGRSRLLVLRELFTVYEANCRGQDVPLPCPQPYREYIAWLVQQDWTRAEGFWQDLLSGVTAPTPLSIDDGHPTPSDPEDHGTQEVRLSETLTSALRALAQQYHLTLNTLLQGAWALLLSRYSGEDDVVFGATRAGRRVPLAGAETMVGLLINTLPVRLRVSPDQRLLTWLHDLRAQWVAMREREQTPLVRIQGWSEVPAGQPLFESLVVFENHFLDSAIRAQAGSWANRTFQLRQTTNYPLTVTGYDGAEMVLEISYDRQRFHDPIITRMLAHVQIILEGMLADPEQRLRDVPMLTEAEWQQVLVTWNRTAAPYPQHQAIHQRFEAQAEQTSEAIAVVYDDQHLTYGELNRRANQLAHYLKQRGIGPEDTVGLCIERSVEMIVALLGILKAGGAYVPLEPTSPQERLAFLLADTEVTVLLTQDRLVKHLPETAAQVICLDTDWASIAQEAVANLVSEAAADNLAYVMYTSGSTGRPKGVSVIHRSVVRLVNGTTYAHFSNDEIFLQLAPLAFDASTFEIWGPLLNGARLVVLPPQPPSLAEIGQTLEQQKVTTLWLTAGLFHLMVESQLDRLRGVRQLLAGGDVLSVPQVQTVLRELDGITLINGYGPTEGTTFTCCHSMTASSQIGRSAPIGRPIANTQVYVLDAYLQPVPVGVPGELYIGGDGLARGYFKRPGLTAERFVPHPFSALPGVRFYQTGDRVRYRTDGTLEFLGRQDHQVKVRGFRIELGEIEAVLKQHAGVQEAVLLAQEDRSGDKRLVAYVVPEPESAPTVSELRRFLAAKLPAYMVPSAFVCLDALPLTRNGKVDHRALPRPEPSRVESEETIEAPRSPVEETLAGIWADILGLDRVGRRDNFIELGGHSLLATRVMVRVHDTFQMNLPVRCLFETPTVAEIARRIETMQWAAHGTQNRLDALPNDWEEGTL